MPPGTPIGLHQEVELSIRKFTKSKESPLSDYLLS